MIWWITYEPYTHRLYLSGILWISGPDCLRPWLIISRVFFLSFFLFIISTPGPGYWVCLLTIRWTHVERWADTVPIMTRAHGGTRHVYTLAVRVFPSDDAALSISYRQAHRFFFAPLTICFPERVFLSRIYFLFLQKTNQGVAYLVCERKTACMEQGDRLTIYEFDKV